MILPRISKSVLKVIPICAWKVHAHKNLGYEEETSPAGEIGNEFHVLQAKIWGNELSLDEAIMETASREVSWLLDRAFKLFPPPIDQGFTIEIEKEAYVTKTGQLTKTEAHAVVHGFLDVVMVHPDDPETIIIIDWKSGRWEEDDENERHIYAGLIGKALYPQAKRIIFELRYIRSGNIIRSEYCWDSSRTVQITTADGTYRLHDTKGPFVAWIQSIARKIRQIPPEPRPGRHCRNWFGRPCQFLGKECPLSQKLPAISESHNGMLESRQIADAFLQIKNEEHPVITPEIAALAWQGVQQLKTGTEVVEQRIKQWSAGNGHFTVGDDTYGWTTRSSHEVDLAFVLELMVEGGVPYEEIAKVLNASKTSLKRLSGRKYPKIKELITEIGITTTESAPRFGVIDDTNKEDTDAESQ